MSVRAILVFTFCSMSALVGSFAAKADDVVGRDQIREMLKPKETTSESAARTRGLGIEVKSVAPEAPEAKVILRVNFEINSDVLTADARSQLDELAAALQSDDLKPHRFEISGHTDRSGTAEYNRSLSTRRAASVVAYLRTEHNVDVARLDAVGFGFDKPYNSSDPFAAENRRVEVRTLVDP